MEVFMERTVDVGYGAKGDAKGPLLGRRARQQLKKG